MADRRLFHECGLNPRLTRLKGQFGFDASMDPSSGTGDSRGVTATKQSAGKYRLTWADTYAKLISFQCSYFHDSSTTGTYKRDVRGGAMAEASNYVEILMLSDGVSLTNPSTGAVITWSIEFEDGSV